MFRYSVPGFLLLCVFLPAPAEASVNSSSDEDKELKSESQAASAEKSIRYKPRRNFSDALQVGDKAPGFSLKALHGDEVFTLEDYRGKKPVVLFFGSYT